MLLKDLNGRLDKGEQLVKGQGLVTANGKYHVQIPNLALYWDQIRIWSSSEANGVRFVMEVNGNAVLYDDKDNVLFSTGTVNKGDYFELLDTGIMVVKDTEKKTIWSSNIYLGRSFYFILILKYFLLIFLPKGNRLHKGQGLKPDERLVSENRRFNFELNSDGQLYLSLNGFIYWYVDTESKVDRLSIENDGNAAAYDIQDQVVFSTGTNTGQYLILENDGNLVMRDINENTIWSSQTTHCTIFSGLF